MNTFRVSVLLMGLLFVSANLQGLICAQDEPSYDHLVEEEGVGMYLEWGENFDRDKAVGIIERYLKKHRKQLSDEDLIRIYMLAAGAYSHYAPSEVPDKPEQTYKYELKALKTSGIKLNNYKLRLMSRAMPIHKDGFLRAEYYAGFHQLFGFIQLAPKWFLRKYVIGNTEKEKQKNKQKIRKFTEKYQTLSSNFLVHYVNATEQEKEEVRSMF